MCCLVMTLFIFGPRLAFLLWWIMQPVRIMDAFNGMFIWPLLGIVFLPWTTIMWVLVAPNGIVWFDWVWLALALFVDIASYGGGYMRRDSVPGYPG